VRDQRVVTFLTGDQRRRLEQIADDAQVSISRACHNLISKGIDEYGAQYIARQPGGKKEK